MTDKVAVVTGSNKGIGYAVVRELCKRGVGTVYLTARDEVRGKAATDNLRKEGYKPEFHQLDITNRNSVKKFADHVNEKHGGLDILINNAAIIQKDFIKTTYEEAKHVIDVNYYSLFIIEEILFPILKDNGRVINVSSDLGHISNLKNKHWIYKLTKDDATVEDINDFLNWFLDSLKNCTFKEDDFAVTALIGYRVSKIAVCALTRIQCKKFGRNIAINSLHPGFVKTDMTNQTGFLTVEQSSQSYIYLALECDQSVKGKFVWFDKSEKEWDDPNLELPCVNKDTVKMYIDQMLKT